MDVGWKTRGLQRFDNGRPSALQTLYPLLELSALTGLYRFCLEANEFVSSGGESREVRACSESSILFLQFCHAFIQISELRLALVARVLGCNPTTRSFVSGTLRRTKMILQVRVKSKLRWET